MYARLSLSLLFVFFFLVEGMTQVQMNLAPRGLALNSDPSLDLRSNPVLDLRQPDLENIRRQDLVNPGNRFAAPVPVNWDLSSGTWRTLDNGDRLWQLKVHSKDALGMAFFYDKFYLPPGSTLHMYDPSGKQIKGAYSYLNNPTNGKFLTGFVSGESVTLEYYEPRAVRGEGRLHVFRVDYAYHEENYKSSLRAASLMEFGFGTSFDCHDNINCNVGQAYQDAKRAVCRILIVVEEGTGFCTGTLVNNTLEDDTPLVLSAFHCQDLYTPLHDFWRFDFNFEATACTDPSSEPDYQSILGCTQRAGRRENDFLLLELDSKIPSSFNAYFLGWNRADIVPQDATMVHQPRGDIKKIANSSASISVFNGPIQWNNEVTTPAQHHFTVNFDDGSYEVGSSGAALLDQNQRIVGQLHGGSNSTCDAASTWFGRLSLSWEGGGTPQTRLKDWLDPSASGAQTLDAKENENSGDRALSGMFITDAGDPIPNVEIQLLSNQGLNLSTVTDNMGNYSFSSLPIGADYQINPFKSDEGDNGLSVLDLIQVRRHILNINGLTSPFQILAADVNDSGAVSTLDLILIQKVILGKDGSFSALPIWTFLPADIVFIDNSNPFAGLSAGTFILSFTDESPATVFYDVLGIKTGDVNNSADLSK